MMLSVFQRHPVQIMRDMDGNEIGMTPKQVADRIGVRQETLYNWRRARTGPAFYKIQGHIYYKPADIENWIAAQRQG